MYQKGNEIVVYTRDEYNSPRVRNCPDVLHVRDVSIQAPTLIQAPE